MNRAINKAEIGRPHFALFTREQSNSMLCKEK